jgi:y4mF family transcriptional regulator
MRLNNAADLGRFVREQRRAAGLSQTALAERSGVSRRWLSDLETGKPTAEVGLVFRVLAGLGLMMLAEPLPHQDIDLDALLDGLGRNRA